MEIVYDETSLRSYMHLATQVSPEHPILVDKFLEDAIEVDVDAVSDGQLTVIGGMLEHVEQAGVHSGDAAMVLPPHTLPDSVIEAIREATMSLAKELQVIGLMNVQFAVKGKTVYVLEVNPRASRTIPFISKATGIPLAKLTARVMAGSTLTELGFTKEIKLSFVAVKESVLPFSRFFGADIILTPEMRSTGEVMGIDNSYGIAFAKSQMAAYSHVPLGGTVFLSVRGEDKAAIAPIAKRLFQLGFKIVSTEGTAKVLQERGIPSERVKKIYEGRPHVLDFLQDAKVDLVINTFLIVMEPVPIHRP